MRAPSLKFFGSLCLFAQRRLLSCSCRNSEGPRYGFQKKGIPHSALLCTEEAFVRQKLCWILPAGEKILFFQERAPAFFPVQSGPSPVFTARKITSRRLRNRSRVSRNLWLIFGTWFERGHALSCKNSRYPSLLLFPSSPSNRAAGILPSNEFV